jgi:hypothetical protein
VVGRAVTVGSLSSIKFLLSKIDLNSTSEWKTLARFGRGGTASVVGEGLDQMRKKLLKLEICSKSLIQPAATFSLREKAKNELVASHQNDQIYKSNQRLKNPCPMANGFEFNTI